MNLSIISKNANEKHVKQLLAAAQQCGIEADVHDFVSIAHLRKLVSKLGDVIYWRASSLDIKSERAAAGALLQDKYLINEALFKTPYVTHKLYQQAVISRLSRVNTIPTHRFSSPTGLQKAITAGTLTYPFIAKPNLGARGQRVYLIESPEDLQQVAPLSDFIFQPYIKNTGDWRVLILGGKVLGVMRRTAASGSHLNNTARGGTASLETNQKILDEVAEIALRAAAALQLTFCGIDIIQDDNSGEYYFLESNSAPQWQQFQKVTGLNVAELVVDHCADVACRRTTPTPDLVKSYYQKSINTIGAKTFHFASRLYLWSGDQWARQTLDELQPQYLGKGDKGIEAKFSSYLNSPLKQSFTKVARRRDYFDQFERLRRFNKILFKVLFAQTLYGHDLRPQVRQLGLEEEMLAILEQLRGDESAMQLLSTRAINYIYLLHYYFRDEPEKVSFDPEWFLQLAQRFDDSLDPHHAHKLKIYLLTHAIIGASHYYNHPVDAPVYRRMVAYLEEIIHQQYFTTTLDTKFEFLVCAALTRYETYLKPIIHSEASRSLSACGNFIVDQYSHDPLIAKDQLWQSEHRNVLYLMSTMPFAKVEPSPRASTKRALDVIGRKTFVSIPAFGLDNLAARVDTGAFWNALHGTNIREEGGKLTFNLLDPQHPKYDHKLLSVTDYKKTPVKNTSGIYEDRYVITLDIIVRGKEYRERFTLSDRSHMMFPVLLGRTFLKKRYLVDPSRLVIDEPASSKEISI
jgi:RimK family alpha-L-glutamate ligase